MIVEKKTNLYDALKQIIDIALSNTNLYTRVGVVREQTLPTYTIELTNQDFDYDVNNEKNYLYEVENILSNEINVGSYVYITYVTNDMPIIFKSLDDDKKYFYATTLVELSGNTINIKTDDDAVINLSNDITITSNNGKITISTGDGAIIELDSKILIENSSQNLLSLLQDILSSIQAITVPTPAGTSGPPINIADFINYSVQLGQLLK